MASAALPRGRRSRSLSVAVRSGAFRITAASVSAPAGAPLLVGHRLPRRKNDVNERIACRPVASVAGREKLAVRPLTRSEVAAVDGTPDSRQLGLLDAAEQAGDVDAVLDLMQHPGGIH